MTKINRLKSAIPPLFKKIHRLRLFERWNLFGQKLFIYAVCFSALLLLTGCASLAPNDYGIESDTTIYLAAGQPRSLDPATAHSGGGGIIGHVFSGLVELDTDMTVRPELAVGWDISDDGLTYTFFLHPNARFHDGRDITAADVIYSWERALNPETESDTAITYLGDIVGAQAVANGETDTLAGVVAIDDKTLAVTIDSPKAYFLAKLTYTVSKVVDRNNVSQSDWEYSINGSGPFKLETWLDDELIVLEANADYYGGTFDVQHVVYEMGGLPLSQYEQDEIDLTGIGGSTLARAQDPNDPLSADLRTNASLCTTFIGLNHDRPPLNDVRVRQALNYAIDKDKIINGLFSRNALPATGILPPGMPGYTGLDGFTFDPERARDLFAEAGLTEPITLTFTSGGYDDLGPLATAVISMWEEHLPIKVAGELVDPFIYLDQLYTDDVGHFFNYGWCADYVDPENFLDVLFHSDSAQNLTGYANSTVDGLLEEARVLKDSAERMSQYAAIEEQIVADAPYILIGHGLSNILVKPRIEGYVQTPIGVAQWHRVSLR